MEVLKRSWLQIRQFMEGLTWAHRMLLVMSLCLGLIGVAALVFWASQPERVSIGQYATRASEIAVKLNAAGFDAQVDAGSVTVPRGQRDEVWPVLAMEDLLAENAVSAFDDMIKQQSPWTTERQNQRAMLVAKANVLSRMVSNVRGVRSAEVIISEPKDRGFGTGYTPPSASVTVRPESGASVGAMKEGIAALVAGAVAELRPQDVAVIDASTGRQHKVGDENAIFPTEALELVAKLESQKQLQIESALAYIRPRAIVAVHITTDTIQTQLEEQFDYSETEPLESERQLEEINSTTQDAGEPGVRSNAGLDINGGSQAGTESTRTEREATYRERDVVRRTHTTRRGTNAQTINVTVNVPRGYFVTLWHAENPPAEGEEGTNPTDADLEPIRTRELANIERQVQPLVAAESQGLIVAHMVPDDTVLPAMAGVLPASALDQVFSSQWVGPGSAALMAMLSLALMLAMVRKATQPESLPSVEELAGVPPTLPDDDDDLIGEVEEQEMSLEGMELDEDELRSRRISEQIGEMIKANPEEAGRIMRRWVSEDEY
ncbi:MAG: hypothetical protein AAF078_04225 [Planctomycetota bacterium]